jgi:two-component system chemotaxis response regulator CheY
MGRILVEKILIVDDSSIIRNMVSRTLESIYSVVTANDGVEGLRVWRAHRDTVALILTDVNMPNMDGYEFVKTLRSFGAVTPVLFLTTESDANRKQLGKELGAQGWMVKPFSPDKLKETVAKAIANSR